MILSCQNICKTFVEKPVLQNISFHLNENDRLAIIGYNGAGKSTLLKILIGEISYDEGEISLKKDASIGYLAQHQDHTFHHTIFDELLSVKKEVIELNEQMRTYEQEMKHLTGDALEQKMNQYTNATHRFEQLNGFAYKSEITGILNGTTNYMMYKMATEGSDFDVVLKEAQQKGYAEADPTADVEGYDACRKIAILSSLAYGKFLNYEDVYTEGITKITAEDIAYAKEFDCVIKLLAVAHNTDKGIEVGVYPVLLGKEHPLSSVRDSFNAVFVHGDAVDDAMFYGRGAGEMPTASAVVGDVIDVARNLQFGCNGRISCTCYQDLPVKPFDEVKNKFFLRMQVKNEPGVLAKVASVFGGHKVSIRRVVQKHVQEEAAELVISTEKVKEYHIKDALRELQKMDSISEISSMIREY